MGGAVRWACGLFAVASCLQAPDSAGSEPSALLPNPFVHTRWGHRDGLPRGGIVGLAASRRALLWVCTREGPLLFDGTSFSPLAAGLGVSLESRGEAPVLEDRRGGVWLGLWGRGLLHVAPDRVRLYTTADGLPSHLVTSLCEDSAGAVWVGTRGGLGRLSGGRIVSFGAAEGLADPTVRCLLVARDGTLYAGTLGGGLAVRPGRSERFTRLGRAEGLPSDYVFSLCETADGRILIGTGEGVVSLERGLVTPLPVEPRKGLVYGLAEDGAGRIWATLFAHGLHVLHDGRFVKTLSGPDGLEESPLALLSAGGFLWASTAAGLHRVSEGIGRPLPGLPDVMPTAVLEDRSRRLAVGTTSGLFVVTDGAGLRPEGAGPITTETVWSLARGSGDTLLVGTDAAGILEVSGSRVRRVAGTPEEATDSVAALLVDRKGGRWAGTYGRGLRGPRSFTTREGLSSDTVIVLLEDREGTIWIGTTAGLDRLRGGQLEPQSRTAGISDSVCALFEDGDGALWIGTAGGLVRRSPEGTYHRFGPREGFPATTVAQLLEDPQGRLWFGGAAGYFVIPRADLVAVAEARSHGVRPTFVGPSEGLRGTATGGGSSPVAARLRDGRLALATDRGLVVVDPSRLRPPTRPRPRLTRLTADGRQLWSAFHPLPGPAIEIPPGTRTLEIAYSALSPDSGEGLSFRHRLDGFDREWIEDGARTGATYTNLEPGAYRFRLEALRRGERSAPVENGGPGQPLAAELPLDVRPRFVQTGAFRVLLASTAMLVCAGLYRLRVSRLEARSAVLEERNRIAREVHDTLSHSLAAIATQLEVAHLTLSKDPHPARNLVEGARSLARDSLEEARRSVRALRPLALDNASLADALARLLSQLEPGATPAGGGSPASPAGAGPRILGRISRDVPRLDPQVEEQVFRVAQEAVTNALRHAGARTITVELLGSPRELTLTVSDDGHGFAPPEAPGPGGGLGLVGMRERVARVRGRLELKSQPGAGTFIRVRVPAPRSLSRWASRIGSWLRASAS